MRFSKLCGFGDKKQLSSRHLGSSSVHPTCGADYGLEGRLADVRFAKVAELLGAQSQSEFLQIFALVNNFQKQERQEWEGSATSFAESNFGDGEDEPEGVQEQVDTTIGLGLSQSHLPASPRSFDRALACSSPCPALVMPASPPRLSAEEMRSSASSQPASNRGMHSVASEEASSTPFSPERHYLPSPPRLSTKDHFPMGHPLPAPPSPLAKHAISAASSKHRSSSSRNSVARQLPLPCASNPPGLIRTSENVLLRDVNDSVRELEKVCGRSPSTSGTALIKSLSQAVQESISIHLSRSAFSASTGEFSTAPPECPCPPLSTPHQSPPGTPSRAHELYRLSEPTTPAKSPRKTLVLSSMTSPPVIMTHIQPLGNQSPPYTPPLSPAACIDSPSRASWSYQVLRCPRKWKKGAKLGQGTFGTVYEGWNQEDGSFFAVKISSREDAYPETQREVAVLSRLEHPNIVRYLGSCVEDGHLCIFLELVRMGSLESIMKKYSRFIKDSTIRTYTRQILHGLEYLHERKTIHRDIKCANILIDVNGQVKLADFGVAKQVDESLASSIKGTPLYMAPEVLTAHGTNYSFPADIWSLGCTVLEMAAGKPPWSDLHGFGFFFKVKKGELPSIPEHTSPEGKDFILKCLRFEPQDRPTAKELLQHPFVANVSTPEDVPAWSWL